MIYEINQTHRQSLASWVPSASKPTTEFPIQNLPFGVFRKSEGQPGRVGIAIGDQILDLTACNSLGLFSGLAETAAVACESDSLNALMGWGPEYWSALRKRVSELLREGSAEVDLASRCLVSMAEVELLLPARIGGYTDFYASIHHATNVGSMFRPNEPLLPNYKYVPIGYHGRVSSIIISGTPIPRPSGQIRTGNSGAPQMQATSMLDYEMEVGCFVGPGNAIGEPIKISQAERHLFGICLLNDWSARDIQSWEYQPLGPFLAKNFATSVSPWIVTMEALAPFRTAISRSTSDPQPLPYLAHKEDMQNGALNLTLQVLLSTKRMREQEMVPMKVSEGNFRDMYWTLAQMLTHHTSNGCNLQPGDLLGSGTVSGNEKSSRGCLLELTWRGSDPLELPTGEIRKFLEDGDEVTMKGFCEAPGFRRIGLGECRGTVVGMRG